MAGSRRGFVLLAVLAVIASTCTIAVELVGRVGLARRNLAGLRSTTQHRWGRYGLEESLLTLAMEIDPSNRASRYGSTEERDGDNVTVASGHVQINGARYDWVLSNEQAKLNVNLLQANLTPERLTHRMRAWRVSADRVNKAVQLSESMESDVPFSIYDSIFPLVAEPDRNWAVDPPEFADLFTCWSPGGRLDWRRASAESLRVVLELVITPALARKVIELRENLAEADDLNEILAASGVDQAEATRIKPLLADHPRAFSIRTSTQVGQRFVNRMLVVKKIDGTWKSHRVHLDSGGLVTSSTE